MHERQTLWRAEIGESKYYLLTDLVDRDVQGFDLTITDGNKAWKQHVDSSKIVSLASAVEMSPTLYMEQTARALTGRGGAGQDNFVYQAHIGPTGSLEFLWKKQVGDGVKFQLGSLSLPELDDKVSAIRNMFDFAIQQTSQLKEDISSLESDNARLSAERKSALKLLDKCVSAKENMEVDLYQKFCAVLNDKKGKIRTLKKQLEELPLLSKPSSTAQGMASIATSSANRTQDNQHYESDTEDELDSTNSNPTSPSPTPEPSSSQAKNPAPRPSLLPDEEDTAVAAAGPKRRRRREPQVSETSAKKLVLPKVPSVKKTLSSSSGESTSSGSRTRARKRLAEKAEVDVDDLMAEM